MCYIYTQEWLLSPFLSVMLNTLAFVWNPHAVLKPWLAGTSANIVDANLGILRGRIAEVKMKEKLDAWCRLKNDWNYQSGYDHKYKRDAMLSESLEIMGFASGALGFVFLSGSLCIWLVSLLVHLTRWKGVKKSCKYIFIDIYIVDSAFV